MSADAKQYLDNQKNKFDYTCFDKVILDLEDQSMDKWMPVQLR